MRVLAIDPGAKTGVAIVHTNDLLKPYLEIVPNGLTGLQAWYERTRRLSGHHLDAIVVETFELEEGTHGVDLTPVGIIDWIKTGGLSHNYHKAIVWQRRNQRGKGKLISVPVLKRAGLYPKRGELKEGHQVAALQHALRYLVSIRDTNTIKLLHPREEIA